MNSNPPAALGHHSDSFRKPMGAFESLVHQVDGSIANTRLQRLAGKILFFKWFDHILSLVIMVNTFVMIVETNHNADEHAEGGIQWTDVFGLLILIIFVIELVLRLVVYRGAFWSDTWNVFDFLVVFTDTLFTILGPILGSIFPISILRIFRLSKLARISKILRVFPELRLLVAGLLGSMSAIFWGTLLLVFVLLVWAMVAVNVIHPMNREIIYADCERCSRAFGTVESALLTFVQQIVAGDSWGQVTIPIVEAHPITAVFFLLVYLSVGMGVLNLIVGVVVNVITRAHDSLREEAENDKNLMKMVAQGQILRICKHMDAEHSGYVTKDELIKGFAEDDELRASMKELDIAEEDLQVLWIILDSDQSGKVSYHEFANSIYKIKSSHSHFMLAYIKYYITLIKQAILGEMASHQQQLSSLSEKLDAESKIVEEEEAMLLDIVGKSKKFGRSESTECLDGGIDLHASAESLPTYALPLQDKVESARPRLCAPAESDLQGEGASRENKAIFTSQSKKPRNLIEEKDTNLASEKVASGSDRFEKCLQESNKIQSELICIMKEFRASFDQQAASIQSLARDAKPMKHLDLLAVPDQSFRNHSSPLCCGGSWSLQK